MKINISKFLSFRDVIRFNICLRYNSDTVRVRFAPSPTGYLHLGGLRTALYNYLFAKKFNGKFLIRIEDTDQTRIVFDATDKLLKDLEWTGIDVDEGPLNGGKYGPYFQSKRLLIYQDYVDILLKNGSAYHCFCTEKRLQLLRKEALRLHEIPKYDNKCRRLSPEVVSEKLSKGEQYCIRFKISDTEESFDDLIYGKISHNISLTEGDPIIIKSDRYPTYHFANVVDDHLMNISHVLRGVEWQISTTKHILLYRAFNWTPPIYGHLPLLMNADGTKLSKRQGDIKISDYRDKGIFPLALINFISLSGGGFAKDSERHLKPTCYSMEELVDQFDISRISTHSGKLMLERLPEFNRYALRRKLQNVDETKQLIEQVIQLVQNTFPERHAAGLLNLDEPHILRILKWSVERISKLSDLVAKDLAFVWIRPYVKFIDENDSRSLRAFKEKFEGNCELKVEDISRLCRDYCRENNIQFGAFMKMMRNVLTGLQEGPSVAEIMLILGKETVLDRINDCLSKNNFR